MDKIFKISQLLLLLTQSRNPILWTRCGRREAKRLMNNTVYLYFLIVWCTVSFHCVFSEEYIFLSFRISSLLSKNYQLMIPMKTKYSYIHNSKFSPSLTDRKNEKLKREAHWPKARIQHNLPHLNPYPFSFDNDCLHFIDSNRWYMWSVKFVVCESTENACLPDARIADE